MSGVDNIEERAELRLKNAKDNSPAVAPKNAAIARPVVPEMGACDKHTLKNLPLTKAHFLDAYSKVCESILSLLFHIHVD